MNGNDLRTVLTNLGKGLVSTGERASNVSKQLSDRCKITESLKVDIVVSELEKERRRIAGARGFTTLRKDNQKMNFSLVAGLAGMIAGAAINKNAYAALSGGLGTFNSCLQGFGQSLWAVSLDRPVMIVPRHQITPGRVWATWESFIEAVKNLRVKALNGKQLGDVEAILSELNQEYTTLKCLVKLHNGQIYSLQQIPRQQIPS